MIMDLMAFSAVLKHLYGQLDHISNILHKKEIADLAQDLTDQIKGRHGKYPDDTNWPQLAPSTQADRTNRGYSPNDPLLRSGDLKESYDFVIEFNEGAIVIGSPLDEALYNEIGTSKSPARPLLLPTVEANQDKIQQAIGEAFVADLFSQLGGVAQFKKSGH